MLALYLAYILQEEEEAEEEEEEEEEDSLTKSQSPHLPKYAGKK